MPKKDWVTLKTVSSLGEAEVLKGFLESEGIEAFIPEEQMASILPMNLGLGVRVQVDVTMLERARSLLDSET